MAKISKDCAKTLAGILTQKKENAWKKEKNEFMKVAGKIYLGFLPTAVRNTFKKHPGYFHKTSYFQVYTHGLNGEYIDFTPSLPEKSSGPNFQPSEKDCKTLRSMYDKVKDLENEYYDLKKEIENALLLLGTSKKVVEVFPESAEFLNKYFEVKHLPAVINIDSIKRRLK